MVTRVRSGTWANDQGTLEEVALEVALLNRHNIELLNLSG
jgi:hypothetical protein